MRPYLVILLAACVTLPGMARADIAPLEARALATDAVDTLCELNKRVATGYYHSGEWDKSVMAMDRVIVLDPQDIEPYSSAAWLLWGENNPEIVMDYYLRMIAANPTEPQAYFEAGYYYYINQRNYAAALPYLEKSVALGLSSPTRHLYGHCLERLGRAEDALAFWRTVLAEEPTNEVAQRQIARLTGETPPPATSTEETTESTKQ